MADVSVPLVQVRAEPVTEGAAERFLTRSRVAALAVFLLFAATFEGGGVHDDGAIYFDFLRRLFGVHTDGVAYQFGSIFWSAPFWLASQLVAVRGGFDHFHSGEIGVAVASNLAVLIILYLGWRILRELDLPRGPAVLLLTLFGTPLYFYGGLDTSYKHAADTLYATAAFWFVLRSSREDGQRRDYIGAGVCFALLLATRYANIALLSGVLVAFTLLGRRRAASWLLATAVICGVLLFAVPVVRHIPYATPGVNTYGLGPVPVDFPTALAHPSQRIASGSPGFLHPVLRNAQFQATAPLKMLFTLHRGLFVWTPLTAFATVGFVLLTRRDRRHRVFLVAMGASALGLLLIHALWGKGWDGGGSFSQRFLTALFPFFLLGTAEFVRRTKRLGIALLAACALFSVWIGLVFINGYYGGSERDGIVQVIGNFHSLTGPPTTRFHTPPPYDSIENFGRQIGDRISERWQLYWRLVT